MNDAWDRGAQSLTKWIAQTARQTADTADTFEATPGAINLPLSFGNRDAAAFHDFKSFTSAIVTDADLATALKESLTQALAQGQSLQEWKKTIGPLFDKLGYTRLNPWQAEFIYHNKTGLAYGVGQWAKLQDVKDAFPYWQYSTRKDHRVRDAHRALEGKIFASEDKQYYPPLGWNCRCTVIPISKRKAQRLGITKPDTVTAEMRSNLADAQFIGDKVKHFQDWLNEKMATLDPARQELIRTAVAEIKLGISEIHTAYSQSPDYTELAHDTTTDTFIVQHLKADKDDLKQNLDAAKRLYENGLSVVINEHVLQYKHRNPEFTIIDQQGRIWVSDLKTPLSVNGIKTAFRGGVKKHIRHIVIDITFDQPLESIADGINEGFKKYPDINRIIILMGRTAVEVRRTDYARGKTLEVVQDGLK